MSDKRLLIRVYGDSLGMPRADSGVRFDQTYSELFCAWLRTVRSDAQVHLYNRSQGGASIRKLFQEYQMDSIYFGKPGGDILVLQLGIVDCAPRPIPTWVKFLIGRLPSPLRTPIVKFLHRFRPNLLRMGCKWRSTSRSAFSRLFQKWLQRAANDFARIYVVSVMPTTPEIEARSPGLGESAVSCNQDIEAAILSSGAANIHFIDAHRIAAENPDEVSRFVDASDGHHLTAEGHRLLSGLLIQNEKRFASP